MRAGACKGARVGSSPQSRQPIFSPSFPAGPSAAPTENPAPAGRTPENFHFLLKKKKIFFCTKLFKREKRSHEL
ncbi:unnamed protein product, partial [Gulo gulo]